MNSKINTLLKEYNLSNKAELFEEMSNCLEIEISESNFEDFVDDFHKYHPQWLSAYESSLRWLD